ncbi:MAG: hypothetical protein ACJAVT_000125 [Yoonia sp.]
MAAGRVNLMLALNEVGGMVQKAARGAGIPLGQAEDLGRVAVYMAGADGDISAVTAALKEKPANVDICWNSDAVTVASGHVALVGPIIRDAFAMGYDTAVLADLNHAPLVGAFLAESGVALRSDGRVLTRSDATVLGPRCKPVEIPAADWAIWGDYAAKTYVPETEASRLAGAGAGLTDND